MDRMSKLKEWIYENLVDNDEYAGYLDKYLPLREKLDFQDVDEYILAKHYKKKAIKIVSKKVKKFNLDLWEKPRFYYKYQRKSNLPLKDGASYAFDFRNNLESFFILKEKGEKRVLGVGGSGSSGQRESYTVFNAVFHVLSKKQLIKHHLFKYTPKNRFRFIGSYLKPILTFSLGSNYSLDDRLISEIRNSGIYLENIIKPRFR